VWIVRVALDRPYTFVVLALLILVISPLVILRTRVGMQALSQIGGPGAGGRHAVRVTLMYPVCRFIIHEVVTSLVSAGCGDGSKSGDDD